MANARPEEKRKPVCRDVGPRSAGNSCTTVWHARRPPSLATLTHAYAIAAGIGQEVVDALAATGRHEVLLLSRKDAPADWVRPSPSVKWVMTDYQSVEQLAGVLSGVDTVLCFIVTPLDLGNRSQKNLIAASVQAGARRYAPSEWIGSRFEHISWYQGKLEIRELLAGINKDDKVSCVPTTYSLV